MTKGKCKCFQQSHGNYCVSKPSVQYQGMLRASGNIGVYDVVTFNISADVEKCWEGTGNQATLDAGGYNGVFVNLSGSNLGPNAEPKTTTPILPLTGIALSDELANNDSSQDRTRYSRQISYIFTGVEVDSATPHNQAYAIDWQLNAGSGSHETPSWWNPEDGKQVGVPPCSNYGRLTAIYEVPEGSSSGVKDTSIPLKTAGATNTNGVVVYEQSVLNQSGYPDQAGKVSPELMGTGVIIPLLDPQPWGGSGIDFPESIEVVLGEAFDTVSGSLNQDDVLTLNFVTSVGERYYWSDGTGIEPGTGTDLVVSWQWSKGEVVTGYSTEPFTRSRNGVLNLDIRANRTDEIFDAVFTLNRGGRQLSTATYPFTLFDDYGFKDLFNQSVNNPNAYNGWPGITYSEGLRWGQEMFKSMTPIA